MISMFLAIILGVCCWGATILWLSISLVSARKQVRGLLEEQRDLSKEVSEKLAFYGDVQKSEAAQISVVRKELVEERRKSKEYFDKISEVLAERDNWRLLYNDQAGGHENAQALMMEQITLLANAYRKETGKNFRLDPLIEAVSQDWLGKHGREVRENAPQETTGL